MNWFKEHLNLTLAMVCGITFIIMTPIGYFTEAAGVIIAIYIFAVIAQLGTEIWYLHQKKRSYGFMLLNIIGFIGFIILLRLENRRNPTHFPEDKVMV